MLWVILFIYLLLRDENLFVGNEIKTIRLDSKIPDQLFDDVLLFFITYSEHGGIAIDDLKVVVFDK